MKWEKVKLKDIITIKKGDYITKREAKIGSYPVILGGQEPAYYVDRFNHIGKAIIISRSGASAGFVSFWNEPIFVTDGFIIEPNKDIVFEFVYYLLKSKQEELHNLQRGAAIPHVTPTLIYNLNIILPPYEDQLRIVSILSAYDDLIKNNQKQIKLLEEAAQGLYKEWFVDLRFPGYETTPIIDGIPQGWELCRVDDVIDFNPKVPLNKERLKQSVPMSALSTTSMVLDTDEFTTTFSNSGSKFQNGDTLLARITPCLENGKTAFVSGIESREGAVGSTEYIVMRTKRISPYMVYLFARTDDFRQAAINSMTGSDGRQRAQVDKLKILPYLKPTIQANELFERSVEPMFMQIQAKSEQNMELKRVRDRLLPKLMSGEWEE